MKEIEKHLLNLDEVALSKPHLSLEGLPSSIKKEELLDVEQITILKNQYIDHLCQIAPDLKSYNLGQKYADGLFSKLIAARPSHIEDLIAVGSDEFYTVGRNVLGKLAVGFVDEVLKQTDGMAIFPARDATPFFYIAKTLKLLNPHAYPVALENIVNPVFNRKLWGIEDEQDPESEVLPISHPIIQKLLSQLGFGSSIPKYFVEVGCWGSMIDQLKRQMPHEQYSVYFLFTHLPEYIYGYTNRYGQNLPEEVLETIADTWEAFPKFFKRPTKLIEQHGIVIASLEDKILDSPVLQAWTYAALQGVMDAAKDFITDNKVNPYEEMLKLWALSEKSKMGEFTGVLPGHTETWTEGKEWKANWQWGKIPPLSK